MNHVLSAVSSQTRIGDLLATHLAGANLLGRLQVARAAAKQSGKLVPLARGSSLLLHFDDGAGNNNGGDDNSGSTDNSNSGDASMSISFDLPNNSGVDYLRNLTPQTKAVFDGLTSQYRQLAFTIAGVADVQLVQKIQDALAQTLSHGGREGDFAAAVNKITDEAGIARLTDFSLNTAFNTNMQKAYAHGRFEQLGDDATQSVLPYWQYWTVGDDRVRPEHRVLHGFVARAEDPVWRKIYPPSGFNCRCSVAPLLAKEAPEDADTPGLERLPVLAMALVPAPGFRGILAI